MGFDTGMEETLFKLNGRILISLIKYLYKMDYELSDIVEFHARRFTYVCNEIKDYRFDLIMKDDKVLTVTMPDYK